ncbi:hypothetical protein QBC42DRAFT_233302 [Cladorrhinum samala]|uniref:Apple domain-containing protein n=1 Tax=Cladorrhinum samala TaxID=585594 RepID=A0AAV9HCN0_9PEZI|nr:hypothetical protein QBC42DRAFT_233302 [Cladorrhinum samala]
MDPNSPLYNLKDSLINSHGIELSERPRYQEHDSQPGMEVFEHSTLEVNNTPQNKAIITSPSAYPPHTYPYPVEPYQPHQKSLWEKSIAASWPGGHQPPAPPLPGFVPANAADYSSTLPPLPHHHLDNSRPHSAHSAAGEDDFSSPFDQRPLVVVPPPPRKGEGTNGRGLICGIKRKMFWIMLALVIFLVVVAIATGVGVGVAGRKGNASPQSTPTTSPTTTTTSTRVYPLPLQTSDLSSPSGSEISCPASNLTLYYISSPSNNNNNNNNLNPPSRRFLLLCGRDYNSKYGAVDMYSRRTDTMEQCVEACAAQQGCVGAGWGVQAGKATCWLKSRLGEAGWAEHWTFAVEDG